MIKVKVSALKKVFSSFLSDEGHGERFQVLKPVFFRRLERLEAFKDDAEIDYESFEDVFFQDISLFYSNREHQTVNDQILERIDLLDLGGVFTREVLEADKEARGF